MKRLILLAVVLSVGMSLAGWRGRFDEQFAEATASWTPAALNPIAWYKGDRDATDAMGNYDGTWVGTEAYADGPTGQAFDFDGTGSYVDSGNGKGLNLTNKLSISVWFNPSSSIIPFPGYRELVVKHNAYVLQTVQGNAMQFRFGTGNAYGSIYKLTKNDWTANTWYNVIVTHSATAGVLNFYVNGVLDSSHSATESCGINTLHLSIGDYILTPGAQFAWRGQIDDVLIFDRALNPLEISTLYNESINKDGAEW